MSNMDGRVRAFVRHSFNRCAWGLLGALMACPAGASAQSYTAASYDPTPAPNPWTVSSQLLTTPSYSNPTAPMTTQYTVSNAATGESHVFTRTESSPSSVRVNARGDVLMSYSAYSGLNTATLLNPDGSRQAVQIPLFSGQLALGDDGSLTGQIANTQSSAGVSYRGQRFENGTWYAVSYFYAPDSSRVSDVNSAGVAVGVVKDMVSGSFTGSHAVAVLPGGANLALSALPSLYGANTVANAINDAGWILGSQADFTAAASSQTFGQPVGLPRAVIWNPTGQAFDLQSLVSAGALPAFQLTDANGFLADGAIWAQGHFLSAPDQLVHFKLSVASVPEPQTWALTGLGLVGICTVARRSTAYRTTALA